MNDDLISNLADSLYRAAFGEEPSARTDCEIRNPHTGEMIAVSETVYDAWRTLRKEAEWLLADDSAVKRGRLSDYLTNWEGS